MKTRAKHLPRLALLIGVCLSTNVVAATTPNATLSTAERTKRGKALYEEKCSTVAGEKIYKRVENVEGILLMKVRPEAGDREWADRMWPGAAFSRESRADEYIMTFLGYEHAASYNEPISKNNRGYIGTDYQPKNPSNVPGYRYVDVIDAKDSKRYRYTGSVKVVGRKDANAPGVQMALKKDPNFDMNVRRWTLDKNIAPDPAPRYGVTFEDHVIPEERALGLASSTIKVLDLKTNEVLGEMTRYAWAGSGYSRANPSPWLRAWRCPDHAVGTNAATRKFVDQVLIPKKDQ